ncbi:MAG TPA: hypothetical protein VJQ50_02250 [Terriglobales bacterium]|nr:hypothetical protein [Terriglobales bacterium]
MGRAAMWASWVSATLLVVGAAAQGRPQEPASQLVRRVIAHEVQAEKQDHSYWMFRLQQSQSGSETKTEEVVETPHGWLRRLLAVNGRPLTADQRKKEDERLHKLLTDPAEQRKNQEATRNDVQQAQQLLQMLPDAFLYSYAGSKAGIVKLNFNPNPKFHPQSRKATVFHDMVGSLWLDVTQQRLAGIQGHLNQKVKFAGGLLGYLDKGGTFDVKQTQIAPGVWDVTYMNIQMNGKALFFKTIAVREKDIRSDYRRVSSRLTLAQAAKLLNRQTNTLVSKR